MKKFLFVALLTVLILGLTLSTAMAYSFSGITLSCTSTSDTNLTELGGTWTASTGKTGKVYLYHTVSGVSEKYTNRFAAFSSGGNRLGIKWCTPGSNVPIESSSIVRDTTLTIKGRGNTNYSVLSPYVSNISVSGSYGWPQ